MGETSFGKTLECRPLGAMRNSSRYSCAQNPSIEIPIQNKYPNWKVCPLIKWINFLSTIVSALVFAFSINEITMGFKGKFLFFYFFTTLTLLT